MNENQSSLKKEFTKKEVTRMRNIITGKTGDKTQVLTGYEKKSEDRKEGDVWEDGGRSWTIRNGIKQTISKQDNLKKLVLMPLSCPNCGNHLKNNTINKKMYAIHGTCFDCVVEKEQKIRLEGKWEEYVSQNMTQNKNAELSDIETALEEWLHENNDFISESGEKEGWSKGNKKNIYSQIKTKLEELKKIKL
jgi:hypothetical protein